MARHQLLLLVCLVLVQLAYGAAVTPLSDTTNYILSSSEKIALLGKINFYRNQTAHGLTEAFGGATLPEADNMNQLFWSPCLEGVAKDHVDECTKPLGYNLDSFDSEIADCIGPKFKIPASFVSGESYYKKNLNPLYLEQLLFGIEDWYDQRTSYVYGRFCHVTRQTPICLSSPDEQDSCSSTPCTDFTQMVWAKTRYVGCGYNKCGNKVFFYCLYFNGGNHAGDYPYNADESGCDLSDGCDCDRSVCCSGLCGGYMDDGYDDDGGCEEDDKYDGTSTPGRDMTTCPDS